MTDHNTTPEGFRTAAYLATKARLDARRSRTGKTSRNVTCTPPNVKCGGRCIPPNWDCRIKGQGSDPHLRAVRTDPVSGLANIERGIKRIGKGIRKGSFSEIEGGKRAIVRGVVKATPGDIQRKRALQAQLERRAGGIATALTVVGFGLFEIAFWLAALSGDLIHRCDGQPFLDGWLPQRSYAAISEYAQISYQIQMSVTRCRNQLPDAQISYHIHLHLVTDMHELLPQTATISSAPPSSRVQ